MRLKSIHITKLWRGAVFSLKVNDLNGRPIVWYHCDWIGEKDIHFTAIHTHQTYAKKIYDRYVWLRY